MYRLAWIVHSTGYRGHGDWTGYKAMIQSHVDYYKHDRVWSREMSHWMEKKYVI